jgi:hypothetical protein
MKKNKNESVCAKSSSTYERSEFYYETNKNNFILDLGKK